MVRKRRDRFEPGGTARVTVYGAGRPTDLSPLSTIVTGDSATVPCPAGAGLDGPSGYCIEESDAFGPFPRAMIDTCVEKGGGVHACNSARWSLGFMRWIYRLSNE